MSIDNLQLEWAVRDQEAAIKPPEWRFEEQPPIPLDISEMDDEEEEHKWRKKLTEVWMEVGVIYSSCVPSHVYSGQLRDEYRNVST
jgi:hypothetical protein